LGLDGIQGEAEELFSLRRFSAKGIEAGISAIVQGGEEFQFYGLQVIHGILTLTGSL
jgi:hypothetical protein